jgi:DnaK suppressor protein
MSNEILGIKQELELVKNELLHRLFSETISNSYSAVGHSIFDESFKQQTLVDDMRNDLFDIEIALQKIDSGLYGYCELTGERIPIEKLKVLPTGRTMNDFSYVRTHY